MMENGDRTHITSAERLEIFCLVNEPLMLSEPATDQSNWNAVLTPCLAAGGSTPHGNIHTSR